MRMLHSLGIADLSASVLLQLRRKHPERDRPVPHDLPVQVPAVRVSLTETFRKLRRRAGTGPSGNRNEYLRVLTHSFDDAKADSVMQKYDAFASELASGDLPTWFYGAASIASLMPLVKKAVTQADVEAMRQPDVRPVAVGEVTLRSILTSVTASVAPAMADVLAPQQVAVGVSGGISIMINGIRILLEQRGDFVLVKIDLKNAYNEIDRSALLRRCSEVPELAPFMPLLHATLMSATSLLVGPQRTRLFEQHHLEGQTCRAETSRGGDSATGTQQGGPPSSGAFCIAIQPELAALDAELRPFGGGAWAEMDDIFALGPAAAVFPAVKRFGEAVKASLNLEMQVSKLECFSPEYNLSHCPWREALGAPVGMVLVPEEDGGSRTYRGVMVAGCPMGEAGFVDAWLRAQVSSIVSYIDKTVLSLRAASPHALWAAIYYSCSAKFDFILHGTSLPTRRCPTLASSTLRSLVPLRRAATRACSATPSPRGGLACLRGCAASACARSRRWGRLRSAPALSRRPRGSSTGRRPAAAASVASSRCSLRSSATAPSSCRTRTALASRASSRAAPPTSTRSARSWGS